jgi:hypothetical protein
MSFTASNTDALAVALTAWSGFVPRMRATVVMEIPEIVRSNAIARPSAARPSYPRMQRMPVEAQAGAR